MQPAFNAAASVVDQVNQVSSRLPGQMREDNSGYEIPPSIPMPPSQSQVGFALKFPFIISIFKFGIRCYLASRALNSALLVMGVKPFLFPGLLDRPVGLASTFPILFFCFNLSFCFCHTIVVICCYLH